MLDDKEFFIRKAIGWVLRDTARKRPTMVYDWCSRGRVEHPRSRCAKRSSPSPRRSVAGCSR